MKEILYGSMGEVRDSAREGSGGNSVIFSSDGELLKGFKQEHSQVCIQQISPGCLMENRGREGW